MPQVAAKYDIVGDGWSRRHFFGSFGEVDFNALSLDGAQALLRGGFPYLKKKVVEKPLIAKKGKPTKKTK